MVERFHPKELTSDVAGAKVKNFTPENSGRDRFGNRLFISKDLAYLDGTFDKVEAGILISQEGEQFIKKHPGLLKNIDHALFVLEDANGKNARNQVFGLGGRGTLQAIEGGGQSNVYVMTIGNEKFIIKTHTASSYKPDIHQPYTNEMLQTQFLAADLKNELSDLKVRMSAFLFASGQVSCTRFEEDEDNYDALSKNRLTKLKSVASAYLKDKKRSDSLWKNTEIDLPLIEVEIERIITVPKNFRTKTDGTLVWIDPFRYDRPWPSPAHAK